MLLVKSAENMLNIVKTEIKKKKIPDILRNKILRQMRDICQENASRIKLQKHYLIHTKKSLDMMWLEPQQLSRE